MILKTEFFRNNVASLVKRFIAQGYEAVIAPYWALDVTVPKYWLPEFLNCLDAGESVSQAMFSASRKVYDQFPTPAAWACLHLYGNPNLKIQEH
ncbi:CHAT domain-containing protein [Pedobacter sp. JCM 36344]|uniref:CHAT domain-containing protein n=1 Tax=Pedobacter sp. JCM 36344 TaxID=3374280 RepID=UPI00397BECF1